MFVGILLVFSLLFGQSIAQNLEAVTLDVKFYSPRREPVVVYDGHDSIYTWGGSRPAWSREISKFNISSEVLDLVGTVKDGVGDFGSGVWMGDENLLHFGGINLSTNEASTQIYNFKTDDFASDWTLVSNLLSGCFECVGVWDKEESTYIIGGQMSHYPRLLVDTIYKYSNVSQETVVVAHLPSPRASTSAVFDDRTGNVYIFGGYSGSEYLNDIIKFDTKELSVTKLSAELPVPVDSTCAIWTGKEAYIIGGYGNTSGNSPQIVRFNPTTEEVSSLIVTNFPERLFWAGCVFVEKFNRIYILGGYTPTGLYRDQFMYVDLDPESAITTAGPASETTIVPTTEPTWKTTIEPTTKPTSETTKQPTSETTKERTSLPTSETTIVTTAKPTSETTIETTTETTSETTIVTTTEPTSETSIEPATKPWPETTKQPTTEPTSETTEQPTTKPTSETTIVTTAKPTSETTIETTTETTSKTTIVTTTEPTSETTIETTTETTSKATIVTTTEPTSETIIEKTTVPTSETTIEAREEPTSETTIEPTTEHTSATTIEPTSNTTVDGSTEPSKASSFIPSYKVGFCVLLFTRAGCRF